MRSNLRCWPGDIFGIEAGKSGTSPGDVLGFGWSIVGVAGALQDAVKDMKAIKAHGTDLWLLIFAFTPVTFGLSRFYSMMILSYLIFGNVSVA